MSIEKTDNELKSIQETLQGAHEKADVAISTQVCPYLKQINDAPLLQSLLSDLSLLPEQHRAPIDALRMIAVCKLYGVMTQEQRVTFSLVEPQ